MKGRSALQVENLVAGYDARNILNGVTLSLNDGEIIAVIGPNGAGKTTLLRCIEGVLPPVSGNITITGKDSREVSEKERAKVIASVPQIHRPVFPFKVLEVVLMGRNPHISGYATPSRYDYQVAEQVLAEIGIESLKDRYYTELSGGELQLTLIARALAQEPQIILFDEPTAHLDFKNQLMVLTTIRKIVQEKGISVLMVVHDPNLAMLYSDRAVLMESGVLLASGEPQSVITQENMKRLYGFEVEIVNSDGRRFVLPPKTL